MPDASGRYHIVAIEDEQQMVRLLTLFLKKYGFSIVGAWTGQAGLDVVVERQPDLVLLDLMLPGMDGWEVFRAMKSDTRLDAIPVIVVSALDDAREENLGVEHPWPEGYLKKPFRPTQLLALIREVLGLPDDGVE